MEWTKIPTDLLQSRKSDKEILAITKYQLLWAMLERQPEDKIALRYMSPNQLKQAIDYIAAIQQRINTDIKSVSNHRNRQKIYYEKNQTLNKESDCHTDAHNDSHTDTQADVADKIRIDKKKEINKEKDNNNKYGELKNVILTHEQYETLAGKYPNLDMAIEKLDTWLGTSGSKNRNKNHFAYFKSNSWVWENLPKGEVKTQNIKPNALPVDIDLWNGEYYDFNLSKAVAKAGDNPDWSKYNRETGTFDL